MTRDEACPDCGTDWDPNRGIGCTKLGSDVWKCESCGHIEA